MEGKLQAALDWAQRGFRVFPLRVGGKTPVVTQFQDVATSDPEKITEWWYDSNYGAERYFNVGVLTTGMVVIDIDVKDDKPGLENYAALGGDYESLTVKTPSDGFHVYYSGPDSGLAEMARGLDVRSHNGYVIAPGSETSEGSYTVHRDLPIAPIPPAMEQRLKPPGFRAPQGDRLVDFDSPAAVLFATGWAQAAEPAIEGQNGDDATYAAACRMVRDYALSEEKALEILMEHWNPRCTPPWEAGSLARKISNAYDYGTGPLGGARPESHFGSVEIVPVPEVQFVPDRGFGNAMDPQSIERRPWLITRLLLRRNVTLIPAAGGTGKSILSLTIAAHLAMGQSMGEYKTVETCRSIIYNAEDDLAEQSRRLFAVCQEYGFDFEHVRAQIMLIGSDDVRLNIATQVGNQAVPNDGMIEAVIKAASSPDIGLICFDPLVDVHACEEQSNGQMKEVMSIVHRIAKRANVAVVVAHHTSKPQGAGTQNRAGDPNVSRGAGAVVNAARIVVTLFGASEKDREVYGIKPKEKYDYVRMDDAKMNLSKASPEALWFKKVPFRMVNGDDVGVLKIQDMTGQAELARQEIAGHLANYLKSTNETSCTVGDAVVALRKASEVHAETDDKILRLSIQTRLQEGAEVEGGTIQWVREGTKTLVKLT